MVRPLRKLDRLNLIGRKVDAVSHDGLKRWRSYDDDDAPQTSLRFFLFLLSSFGLRLSIEFGKVVVLVFEAPGSLLGANEAIPPGSSGRWRQQIAAIKARAQCPSSLFRQRIFGPCFLAVRAEMPI